MKSVRGAHKEICRDIKTVRQRLTILLSFIQTSSQITAGNSSDALFNLHIFYKRHSIKMQWQTD